MNLDACQIYEEYNLHLCYGQDEEERKCKIEIK
jgi:hypothetical protein